MDMIIWLTSILTLADFCNKRIYTIPLIFIVQYILAVMSQKLIITYINTSYRKHQHFISILILIGHYLLSLLYFIILTPITIQKLSLKYTGLQNFSIQSSYITYQLQKTRQIHCKLYYGSLNIISFIVIRIATSIWHNKKHSEWNLVLI